MRKEIIISSLIISVLLAMYYLNTGVTGFSTASGEAVIDEQVIENVENEGKAQVIIILKEPKKPSKTTGFITAIVQTKTTQNVLSTLSEDEFEKKYEYSVINGFSGEVTAEGLEKLKHNPNVEKIYFDKTYTLSLTDSIPLINASRLHAYKINGLNLTGTGETICILDTGINYTHESFGSCSQTDFLNGNCNKVPGGYDYVNNSADPYDDHGHGTHVAGIAAANGNVLGTAPGANIAMIKVCDSAGSCSSSSILSGFEWCITNKNLFNISVISMSLGDGGQYNSATCPSNPIDAGIASAYSTGIFTVAASGNNGYTSGISHPACNENVTAAGAVTKTDSITYNRGGDLLTLLAPGVSITSTWVDGSTATLSGTSMSTPHIAGAAAILQQYSRANSTQLTPTEIKTALNNTGKNIYDSSSDKTYTRIDLLGAVRSLTQSPALVLYSPANSTYYTNISLPLEYEAIDLDGLDTAWYNIDGENIILSGNTTFNTTSGSKTLNLYANDTWNNENSAQVFFTIDLTPRIEIVLPQNTTYPAAGLELNFSAIDQDLNSCWYNIDSGSNVVIDNCVNTTLNASEGSHNLKLFVNDSEGNEALAEVSFITDLTNPIVYLESPLDNSFSNYKNIQFKFKAAEANLNDCKLYGNWNSNWHVNQTKTGITSDTITSFDEIILEEGNHTWNVECTDLASNTAFNDTNYTLTIDSTNPSLIVSSPTNTTYLDNTSLALEFSINDNNLDSCWYKLNDGVNTTIMNCENTTLSLLAEQNTLRIYAKDLANNEVMTEVSFTTDTSYPLISLSSPLEGVSVESPANFTYSVNDYGILNCSLWINGTINQTDNSITTNTPQDFSTALTPNSYYWNIKCSDNGNRENASESINFAVCNENWNCTEWAACSNSQQTKTCTDSNSCGTNYSKPATSQTCSSQSTGGTTGSEAAAGPAGSAEISSGEGAEETAQTPEPTEKQPETNPTEEPSPEQPAEIQKTTETAKEEKGFISKALNFLKSLKDRIVNPGQTITSISTRAVDGAKNHKIASITSFVFVISMMLFAHFYFFKRYRMKKLTEDVPIPLPPKTKKTTEQLENKKTEAKEPIFKRFNLFKSYKDLLGPKKPE